MEQQKTSSSVWYEKIWLVVLLCLLFFPFGLYALWKNSSISKGWKIGVSAVFALFVVLMFTTDPPPAEGETVPGETASSGSAPAASEASPSYKVAKVENERKNVYCRVTIDDLYDREALVEITRSLRKLYKPEGKFVAYFYYKKYTDKTSPVAGTAYLVECDHCEYKDKDGELVDFPFHNLEQSAADALRALKFDTAGFKQVGAFLGTGGIAVKNIILSSDKKAALLVYQSTTGHSGHALVKKVVNGEERFYEPDDEDGEFYYRINKDEGFIDFYKNETLDMQYILEE